MKKLFDCTLRELASACQKIQKQAKEEDTICWKKCPEAMCYLCLDRNFFIQSMTNGNIVDEDVDLNIKE